VSRIRFESLSGGAKRAATSRVRDRKRMWRCQEKVHPRIHTRYGGTSTNGLRGCLATLRAAACVEDGKHCYVPPLLMDAECWLSGRNNLGTIRIKAAFLLARVAGVAAEGSICPVLPFDQWPCLAQKRKLHPFQDFLRGLLVFCLRFPCQFSPVR